MRAIPVSGVPGVGLWLGTSGLTVDQTVAEIVANLDVTSVDQAGGAVG